MLATVLKGLDWDVGSGEGMVRSMGLYSTSSGARACLSVEKGVLSSGSGGRWPRCLEMTLRRGVAREDASVPICGPRRSVAGWRRRRARDGARVPAAARRRGRAREIKVL